MSGYTVTVHVEHFQDTGLLDPGHAFITLTKPDGSSITRGYYPSNGAPIDKPAPASAIVGNTDDGGILVDDAISGDDGGLHGADYSVHYEVSEDQYNAMLDHVTAVENNMSDVYIVTDNNCTNFVRDVLEVGSVNHPVGIGPIPDSLIPGEGLISNDNYRFDEEKGWIRNSSPEHLGVLDGAGASAEEISALNQYSEWLLSQGNPEAVPDEWFIDRNEQLSNTPGLGSDVDNEGGGQGYGITAERPTSDYQNDQTLRDFLNDSNYNQHLASTDGGGIAGDYQKYLQEQVADWDDDGDGKLNDEERAFRDDLNATAEHNKKNAGSQSDADADAEMHDAELVADPDGLINQLDSGPGGSAGINPTWGGNDLNNDGIVSDAELLNLQNSAIQSGMRGVNDLYNAIDGGDWLGVVDSGLDVSLAIDQYLDTGTDALGGGSEGFISEDRECKKNCVNALH